MLLALVLVVGLLPVSVFADGETTGSTYCGSGFHTPDEDTKKAANWNNISGGYEYDYYSCSVCGTLCHDTRVDAQYVGHANKGHTADSERGENAADYDPCYGGYQEANYYCVGNKGTEACTVRVKADGTEVPYVSGAHTFDSESAHEADYTDETGGYTEPYYYCTQCKVAYRDNGANTTSKATYRAAETDNSGDPDCTNGHTPDLSVQYPSDYLACCGGIKSSYYICSICSAPCDGNGNVVTVVSGNGHADVTLTELPANYYPCSGGFKSTYWVCGACGEAFGDAAGTTSAVYTSGGGAHTPMGNEVAADYTECYGGYEEDHYSCAGCGFRTNADGATVSRVSGNGHTRGQTAHAADYTVCGGGCKDTWYECVNCGVAVDAEGTECRVAGESAHTLGAFQEAGNVCAGGYLERWAKCSVCSNVCNENGMVLSYQEALGHKAGEEYNSDCYSTAVYCCANGCDTVVYEDGTAAAPAHNLLKRDGEYHDCTGGFKDDYYECADCGETFADAEGLTPVSYVEAISKHTPKDDTFTKANYTVCGGGYDVDHYCCGECWVICDADGKELNYIPGTGTHTADLSTQHEAQWTACYPGFDVPYYECSVCGLCVDQNGNELQLVQPTDPDNHSADQSELFPADYTPCQGGIKVDYYRCRGCNVPVDAQGKAVDVYEGTGKHTTDTANPMEADYTPCSGGFKTTWYVCTQCYVAVDAEGNCIEWQEPTEEHTMESTVFPADYAPCRGGFKSPYYSCSVCQVLFTDAQGTECAEWFEPEEGALHEADQSQKYEGYQSVCGGGYKEDFYVCKHCGTNTYADGTTAEWQAPVHTPGTKLVMGNYSDCGGGYKDDHYLCTKCGEGCTAEGGELEYASAVSDVHTPGTVLYPADYTACCGGVKEDYYLCLLCWYPVNAKGEEVIVSDPETETHIPNLEEKYDANWTACGGGVQEDFYCCSLCGTWVDENGGIIYYVEPEDDGKHKLVAVVAKDSTVEKEGWDAYYECAYCGWMFKDAEGTEEIYWDEVVRPRKAAVNTYELPAQMTVGGQKMTRAELEAAMEGAAIAEGLDQDKATSVSMDIVLQVLNDDDEWENVTQEYFLMNAGLEVVIKFPEGTGKTGFKFVVSHMVTQGPNAGRVETFVLGRDDSIWVADDGIHVIFTSLSPVMVTYQATEASTSGSTSTSTSTVPLTGDDANWGLWLGTLVLSAAAAVLLAKKRRV